MDLSDKLAGAAIALSLAVIIWEIIKFRREGAWVRVTLRPGLYDRNSLRTTGTRMSEESPVLARRGMRFDVEVAVIEVENRGRTPVTVRNVSLDLGRTRRWHTGRRTVSFRLIEFEGSQEKTRVRIDAFDSATFIFDACQAISVAVEENPAGVTIRASADIAGRRAVRSPRRRAWRFAKADRPWLYEIETFDLARQVYRFLIARCRGDHLAELRLPDFAMKVAEQVEAGSVPERDQLEALIRGDADDAFALRMATWALAEELAEPHGGQLDGSGITSRRLARELRSKGSN
jgi:hypothetical protein